MRFLLTATLTLTLLLPTPAMAQDAATRPGDQVIPLADLDARLRGQEIVFFDNGVAHYYNDGRYTYAYDGGAGGYAYGYYEVTGDGTVCIVFLHGFARCDTYVQNGARLVMITEGATRFPIRDERDAGPDPVME